MLKQRSAQRRAAPVRGFAAWNGEHVDVDRFYAEAWVDLLHRQRWLTRTLRLDSAPWEVDQNTGVIRFARSDGAMVSAPVQIVGAWNPRTSMYRWGWDHPMVVQRLRNDAERTRWFGDKHDLPELTTRALRMSEQDVWRLAAVAMKINAAHGVYRARSEGPAVFMTLGQATVRR